MAGYPEEADPGDSAETRGSQAEAGYRTYEIYQRERVTRFNGGITPGALRGAEYLHDPYPLLAAIRERAPCYRDWSGNSFWITRYDDVTSVLTDDASFHTRPKRWFYGLDELGRDLGSEHPVLTRLAQTIDAATPPLAEAILSELTGQGQGRADLAVDLAARFPLELLARILGLPAGDVPVFAERFLRMQRGVHWEPRARQAGLAAVAELVAYFVPLLEQRLHDPGDDLVSVIAALESEGRPTTAGDVVVTLLEADHETLHGALANLWFLLLTNPEQLAAVRADRRMVKFAYLEAMRHSTPVLDAKRFTSREVERFGWLLPEGALVMCSGAAANRDPRIFTDPDEFRVDRKDLCQREPRGQYRADGLPAGVAVGLGTPSRHPALPTDRPRSRYAITRDTVTAVSDLVLDALPDLRLAPGASPSLQALRVGELHTCWRLPVLFGRRSGR